MRAIQIVPLGKSTTDLARWLSPEIARQFSVSCEIAREMIDLSYAFDPVRRQSHSTRILAELAERPLPNGIRVLGVTSDDLYIPILTFVFGEAQLRGPCAVVSTYRLRQEFYGLTPDAGLLKARLLKEAVHELGHTLGLSHCDDYSCVMAPSHAVDWIDLKSSAFCRKCSITFTACSGERVR